VNFEFTWSTDWIQEYESPWGILEKFKYANAIDGNTVLGLIGNENVKQLKNISSARSVHRNLIHFPSIDPKMTENILGINLLEYHDTLIDKLIHLVPQIKYVGNYFKNNLSYCPICLRRGYHSIFHQIRLFEYCAFHPDQKLIDRCPQCKKAMLEYLINKGNNEAYRCSCGYCFLDSENIRSIFLSWKIQPKIQYKIINSWIKLPRHKIHKYYINYPFDNYKKYYKLENNETNYLTWIPKVLIVAFNEEGLDNNNEIVKISSNKGIFKIKNDYPLLKEHYMEAFSYRFLHFKFTEKNKVDSIFFEIYKQTRITYKAITRYILRKIIRKHSICVKIFNKAHQNGDVCPHAFAFVLWRMECEGKNSFSEIETHIKISETYDFECIKERFSTFLHGAFMTHLEELLNPTNKDQEFNFLNCNIASMNYIVNRIISHLLIERYIKWLEVVQQPKKFKLIYPDDNIPMYIVKIPQNMNEEINFYFPNDRINYMKNVIKDINNQTTCPFKRSTQYPPYKSPTRIAMDNMKT